MIRILPLKIGGFYFANDEAEGKENSFSRVEILMDEAKDLIVARSISKDCIARRVRLLNRVVTGLYDRILHPFGIKVNQVSILAMLVLTGPVPSRSICEELLMDKSTVSRNVDRMRKRGWIDISKEGASRIITVTPEGRNLLAAVYGEWKRAQKMAADLMGEAGVKSVRSLHTVVKNKTQE